MLSLDAVDAAQPSTATTDDRREAKREAPEIVRRNLRFSGSAPAHGGGKTHVPNALAVQCGLGDCHCPSSNLGRPFLTPEVRQTMSQANGNPR
eukprot:COSAG05_NODE_13989_length_412_cov_0.555911_2_plen_92_part_01